MIDLTKVVARDNESEFLCMLSSRVVVRAALASSSEVRCCEVLSRFVAALQAWSGERDDAEPIVTGWLNLFVELSRPGREGGGPCRNCSHLASEASAGGDPYLSLLSLFLSMGGNLIESVIGQKVEAGRVAPDTWRARLGYWERTLRGPGTGEPKTPRKPVGRTNLGQTLVMHLLEAILPVYGSELDVSRRGILTLLLVPLLRTVYRHPNRAHTSYLRYFYGTPITTPHREAFHILYSGDLGVLEDFQSRGTTKRPEVLKTLWDHASVSLAQTQDESRVSSRANLIVHGVPGPMSVVPDYPKPKMTRVSQLTCLIREKLSGLQADTNQLPRGSQTKRYAPSPKFAEYRRAEIVDGSPGRFRWPAQAAEKVNIFNRSVRDRYRDGYEVNFLRQLFDPGGDGAGLPAWVQDGEITFLWLLTALRSASDPLCWLTSDTNEPEVWISRRQVTHQQAEDEAQFLKMGASFNVFARERASLFESQGRPRPKAWSLVNFLERAVVSGKPACYAREGTLLGGLANTLYCAIATGPLDLERLRSALLKLLECDVWSSISDLQDLERAARLPTFLLETLLRDADPVPYSLFFYPISFDEASESPVTELRIEGKIPGAFIAGTFAGLEWDCFPSVTERQNYHLFSVLDAIRPIVDHELGLMLKSDYDDYLIQEQKLVEADERRKAADERARTIEAVVPAVEGLSRLFREAQGHVFRIESAVDPDWSGLFTASMQAVGEVFAGKRLDFNKAWPESNGEPFSFEASHESSADVDVQRKLLYRRLVYLARQVSKYESEAPLGNTDGPSIKVIDIKGATGQHRRLFHSNAFLRALFEAMLMAPEEARNLNMLLKLLTTDTADAGRGIHVAQIAAALGMSAAETKSPGPGATPQVRVSLFGSQVSGRSFSPTDAKGIIELAQVVALELNHQPQLKSSSQFRARAFGAHAVQPFQFLRALRVLGGEALATEEKGKLQLLDWRVEYLAGETSDPRPPSRSATDSSGGGIRLWLRCRNKFSAATKLLLWNYQQSPGNEYHNLRFSFGELCRVVGGFPRFLSVDDLEHCPEAEPGDRFLVYEGATESWFRILLSQPAIQEVPRQ